MAPVSATVLYPQTDDSTFDMKYYLATHMPLVMKNWGQYGLKKWEVCELAAGADGSKPYSVQALLWFEDNSAMEKAMGSGEAKDVFGDIPNFSNKQPMLIAGPIVGTS